MSARSGTEKRQRTEQVGVRLTPDELAAVTDRAERAGITVGELFRRAVLDPEPTP